MPFKQNFERNLVMAYPQFETRNLKFVELVFETEFETQILIHLKPEIET